MNTSNHSKRRKSFMSLCMAFVLITGIFLYSSRASAARYVTGGEGTYVLNDQKIDENVYISGDVLEVKSEITGDLVGASREMVVRGNIDDNAFLAGGRIQVDGNIRNDAVIAGGVVILNGSISGDVRIFAGNVYINSPEITGDLHIFAQSIVIDDNVVIKGDKKLQGKEIKEKQDNQINTLDEAPRTYWEGRGVPFKRTGAVFSVFYVLFKFISWIGWLIAGLILLWLFRTRAFILEQTVRSSESLLRSFFWGLGLMILAPILTFLLLFSLVGIPLLVSLALIGLVALIFGNISVIAAIGCAVYNVFAKRETNLYFGFIIGWVLIGLIGLIPIIGFVVNFCIAVVGLGAFVESRRRKRRIVPAAM